jgi:endothelin-converting enzyme/putative endopeptidase
MSKSKVKSTGSEALNVLLDADLESIRYGIQTNTVTTGNLEKNKLTADELYKLCQQGELNITNNKLFSENQSIKEIKKSYDTFEKYKKTLVKQFDDKRKQLSDKKKTRVDPKNDFYTYVNEEWLNEADEKLISEKKYYVQIDSFRQTQEKVYYEVIDLLKKYIKDNPKKQEALSVNNLWNSLSKTSTKNLNKHYTRVMNDLDKIFRLGDMYDILAYLNLKEVHAIGAPIRWRVSADEKNVSKLISHLSIGQLGLYDYTIYIDLPDDKPADVLRKEEVKKRYLEYIKKCFKACLGKAADELNPEDVWDVEYELLMNLGCDHNKKDNPNYYNKVKTSDLLKETGFDWNKFSYKLGYKKESTPKEVVIMSYSSMECLTKLIRQNWSTKKWRTYWLFIFCKQGVRFTHETRNIHYDFFNNYLRGQAAPMPNDVYAISILSFCYNTLLSNLYVNKNKNTLNENYVKNMVEDLKYIFMRRVERNNWLSPSTKKMALKKLEYLSLTIGYPKQLRIDPELFYVKDNIFDNIIKLENWKVKELIKLEGKPIVDIPEIDWNLFKLTGTQPYVVNAYYMPTKNDIYIPLAFLQKPFLDLGERGIEYNLAHVGYVVGHELSHALDTQGSKFDEKGNLNNWWTDADRKKYAEKIKDVNLQYKTFAKYDNLDYDPEIAIGENIADITGIALAEEYLFDFQILNKNITLIKKISLETFYIYLAIQSRQKVSPEALHAKLKTDPHPLEKYRCNCPLSRLEIFRSIFGIKKENKMWWHNNDTIW